MSAYDESVLSGPASVCLDLAASILRDLLVGWPHPYIAEKVRTSVQLIEAVQEEAARTCPGGAAP